MPTGQSPSKLILLDQTDSTNSEAWRAIAERGKSASGTIILANRQTAGRGQRNHRWHSAPGLGLYMTAIDFPTTLPSACAPDLAPLAANAVLAALARLHCLPPGTAVKPPNDILVAGKKLCGVLIETRLSSPTAPDSSTAIEAIVAGFGLNLRHRAADFPPELRDTATSLALQSLPSIPSPAELATVLAAEWRARLSAL